MTRAIAALLVVLSASSAFAWGEKGHLIVNEAATLGLPTDMPHFFYQAYPELTWLGFDPDRWKGGGRSLDAANDPDHFLDYEYVQDLPLPESRYRFIELMVTSGKLRRFGLDNAETGFLPWRIAEVAQTLQVEFRNWRFSVPGSTERTIIERDIIHLAGILGHYAGDSANPHHTTFHYNGWAGPNPHGYAFDCGTHSRFESAFVSRAMEVSDVVPRLAAPELHEDFFVAALEAVKESNAQVEPLYRLDRDGAFQPLGPVRKEGRDFAAQRLARGASFLRDLWWSAWINSAKSTRRSGG
jgi:hypothetical protein